MYLECDDCYWYGSSEELVTKTEDLDDKDFSYCPSCGGNNFQEFEDDEDEAEI